MPVVYLIHFDRPYWHARHYLGYTHNLAFRVRQHASGGGSRLMRAVQAAGISWSVVKTWEGDYTLERALKAGKNSPRLCPVCIQERIVREMFTVSHTDEMGWLLS